MQYEYPPLKVREVRLFRVPQDENSDRLICGFDIASLDSLESAYTAISYGWGDAALTDTVWFNDRQFLRINSSAAYILQEVISCGFTEPTWIDAICIYAHGNIILTSDL